MRRGLEVALLPAAAGALGVGRGVRVDVGRTALLPPPAADLAALEDRAVVGLVAAVLVDVVALHRADAATGAAALERLRLLRVGRGLLRRRTAEGPVAGGREPGGDLVHRRAGDDEDAEDGEQHEQGDHDQRAAQQVHQQRGDHEAERAAGLLEVGGVAEPGLGHAVGDVHEAEHAEHQRGPADDLAAGGAVAVGVAQVAPGDEDEQQRDEPGEQPDRAGDHGAGQVADATRQLPPDRGGDDHGEADEEQAGPVAAVLGLELAGGVADLADGRTEHVRDADPRRDHAPSQGSKQRCDRSRPVADRPGRRPLRLARGAARRRGLPSGLATGRPGSGKFQPCSWPCWCFRDAGGEDVRVAMVTRVGEGLTSLMRYTPGAGRQSPRGDPRQPREPGQPGQRDERCGQHHGGRGRGVHGDGEQPVRPVVLEQPDPLDHPAPPAASAASGARLSASATRARATGSRPWVRRAARSASTSTSSRTSRSAVALDTNRGKAVWSTVNASRTRSCRARRWARSCASTAPTSSGASRGRSADDHHPGPASPAKAVGQRGLRGEHPHPGVGGPAGRTRRARPLASRVASRSTRSRCLRRTARMRVPTRCPLSSIRPSTTAVSSSARSATPYPVQPSRVPRSVTRDRPAPSAESTAARDTDCHSVTAARGTRRSSRGPTEQRAGPARTAGPRAPREEQGGHDRRFSRSRARRAPRAGRPAPPWRPPRRTRPGRRGGRARRTPRARRASGPRSSRRGEAAAR